MLKHKKRKTFVSVLLILAVAAIVGMYLYCCFFVFYAQDDVSFLCGNKVTAEIHPDYNDLQVGLLNGFNYYFVWQGSYLGNFLVFGLMNLYSFGIFPFHIFISCVVLSFFLGLLVLYYQIGCALKAKHPFFVSLAFVLLTAVTGMNVISPADFFYWITGAVAYALPVSLGIWGISCYVKYKMEKRKCWLWGAGILGFLACGGSSMIGPLLNTIYLFLFCSMIQKRRLFKDKREYIYIYIKERLSQYLVVAVPFLCVFIGTLVNVLAPGNFVRKGTSIADQTVCFYISETLVAIAKCVADLLTKSYLPVAVALCVVLVVCFQEFAKCDSRVHPLLVCVYSLFAIFITTLPVVLGYGNGNLPDRTAYLIELFLSVLVMWDTIYISVWVAHRKKQLVKMLPKALLFVTGCVCVINLLLVDFRNSTLWTMRREIKWGTLQKYYSSVSSMWNQLESSEESDVILRSKNGKVPNTNVVKQAELSADPEHWINQTYAAFFDKNSVSLISDD